MRSYSQVVRRHEREAILTQPLSWGPGSFNDGGAARRRPAVRPSSSVPSRRPPSRYDAEAQPSRSILRSSIPVPSGFGYPQGDRRETMTSASPSIAAAREYSNPFADLGQSDHGHSHPDRQGAPRPDSSIMGSPSGVDHGDLEDRRVSAGRLAEWETIPDSVFNQYYPDGDDEHPEVRQSWLSGTGARPTLVQRRSTDLQSIHITTVLGEGPTGLSSSVLTPTVSAWNHDNMSRRQRSQG